MATPLEQLSVGAADYLLAFGAVHGLDVTVLGRDLLEVMASATIGYLVQTAGEHGKGEELTELLTQIVVAQASTGNPDSR